MTLNHISVVPHVFFGTNCKVVLEELIASKRINYTAPFIYLIDDSFEQNNTLLNLLPMAYDDKKYFIASSESNQVAYIDAITEQIILDSKDKPQGVIAIGGSEVVQLGKAISAMLSNPGSIRDYFSAPFVNPSVYKIGIPIISCAGTEVSNFFYAKDQELQVLLRDTNNTYNYLFYDYILSESFSLASHFMTSMQSFVNASVSLKSSENIISKSHVSTVKSLIKEVYLDHKEDHINNHARLLSASWYHGLLLLQYETNIVEVLASALHFVTDISENICMMLVYNKLGHLLKRDVSDFKSILKNNTFVLSTNVIKDLDGYELDLLISQVYKNDAFWESNTGKYWDNLLPKADILKLFKKL